jgi:ABC-type proline/glycine betaine transport system permease subunit
MTASPAVTAAYEAALPDDPSIERKTMFGMPCAFVNRQMFFGTFGETIVARVGTARVDALVGTQGLGNFTPSEGRTWGDYVQVAASADVALLGALATEALSWTQHLPPKGKQPRERKKPRHNK